LCCQQHPQPRRHHAMAWWSESFVYLHISFLRVGHFRLQVTA
jgi:hypothetical protein